MRTACRLWKPAWYGGPTAAEAFGFSAVQLFVERVAAEVDKFELSDADATIVIDICRKLDGIPLAIEFAAPPRHEAVAETSPPAEPRSTRAAPDRDRRLQKAHRPSPSRCAGDFSKWQKR